MLLKKKIQFGKRWNSNFRWLNFQFQSGELSVLSPRLFPPNEFLHVLHFDKTVSKSTPAECPFHQQNQSFRNKKIEHSFLMNTDFNIKKKDRSFESFVTLEVICRVRTFCFSFLLLISILSQVAFRPIIWPHFFSFLPSNNLNLIGTSLDVKSSWFPKEYYFQK